MSRQTKAEIAASLSPATAEEKRLGAVIDMITHKESGVTVRIRLNKSTSLFGAYVNGEAIQDKDGDKLRGRVMTAIEAGLKIEWLPVIEIKATHSNTLQRKNLGQPQAEEINLSAALDVERYYIAKLGDGQSWRMLHWHNMNANRADRTAQLTQSESWRPPYDDDAIDLSDLSGYHQSSERARRQNASRLEQRHGFRLPYYTKPVSEEARRWSNNPVHYLPYSDDLWQALTAIARVLVNSWEQINALVGTPKGIEKITIAGANIPKLLSTGADK